LEAAQEDQRLAAIELKEKRGIASQKIESGPSTDKQPVPRIHQGCKYRLPSADPIAIPKIPYDPFDYRWYHQEMRRRKVYMSIDAPKKYTKAIRELVEIAFEFGFMNNIEYDTYDNDLFGEKDGKQCPICSCPPEAVNQDAEVAVDQVTEVTVDQVTEVAAYQVTEVAVDQEIEVAADQVTEVAADQEIEIGVDVVAIISTTNPATQDTQAITTTAAIEADTTNRKNRINFCLQKCLNIGRRSSVH